MAFCTKCGHELKTGAKFCGNCGSPVVTETASNNQTVNNQSTQETSSDEVSPKSRLVALLLGIFLGQFGVHNFYLGKIAIGVIQAVLTVLGYCLAFIGVGAIMISAAGIWALVEWIIIATGKYKDGKGRLVSKWNE